MSDKLKMLRDVLALATKGPLRVSMSGYSIKSHDPDVPIVAAVHGGAAATPRQLEAWTNNAVLFVEAANHLDPLVDIAEAAEDCALLLNAVRGPRAGEAQCSWCEGPTRRDGNFALHVEHRPGCFVLRRKEAVGRLEAALAKLSAVE